MEDQELDQFADKAKLTEYKNLIIPRKKDMYDNKDKMKKKIKK